MTEAERIISELEGGIPEQAAPPPPQEVQTTPIPEPKPDVPVETAPEQEPFSVSDTIREQAEDRQTERPDEGFVGPMEERGWAEYLLGPGVVTDVEDIVAGGAKGIARGFFDSTEFIADKLGDNVLSLGGFEMRYDEDGSIVGVEYVSDYDTEAPTVFDPATALTKEQSEKILPSLTYAISRFVGAFGAAGKVLPALDGATKAGKAANTLKAFWSGAIGTEPDEGLLGDGLASMGVPRDYIPDILETDMEELEAEGNDFRTILINGGTEASLALFGGVILAAIARVRGRNAAEEVLENFPRTTDEITEAAVEGAGVNPAVVPEGAVVEGATEAAAPATRQMTNEELISNPVTRRAAEQLDENARAVDAGVDPFDLVRRSDDEVTAAYTAFSPVEAARAVDGATPAVASSGPGQAAIRTAAAHAVQKVRDVLLKRTDAPYKNDAKSVQRLKNFLARPDALKQTLQGVEEAVGLLKANASPAVIFEAVEKATRISGLDDTSRAVVQRLVTRQLSELALADAKAVYKAIKDSNYSIDTKKAFQIAGEAQIENWLGLVDESRFIGRGFSLGLSGVRAQQIKEIDKALDDALKGLDEVTKGKKTTKKERAKDLTREGFERARERGFDFGTSLEMADQFAKDLAQVPGLAGKNIDQTDLERTVWQKFFALAKEVFITNILSNPATIAVNLTGTFLNTMAQPAYKVLGGTVSGNVALVRKGLREYYGYAVALKASAKMAAAAWKQREGIIESFQMSDLRYKPLDEVKGQPLRNIGKRMYTSSIDVQTSTDEFFKQMRYRGVRYAEALEIASSKKLTGAERTKFMKDYITKGFDEDGLGTDPVALAEAQRAAFQTPWGGETGRGGFIGDWISGLENTRRGDSLGGLLATVVFPFVRTPSNIIGEMFNTINPLALVSAMRKTDDSMLAAELRAMRRGQFMMGATAGFAFYKLQEMGHVMITGSQESYWNNARQERQVIPPQSLVINDTIIPLSQFAPFTAPLYLLGAFNDIQRNLDARERTNDPQNIRQDALEAMTYLYGTLYSFVGQAPMLTGMESILSLFEVGEKPMGDRFEKSMGRIMSGFTNPGHVKFGMRLWDDRIYENTDFMDYMFGEYKRVIPDWGLANRDVLGNEMHYETSLKGLLRFRSMPKEPGAFLLHTLLKDPNTRQGFLPQGPTFVFKGDKLTKGLNLAELEGSAGRTAWEDYKKFRYDTPASETINWGSSGRAATTVAGIRVVTKGEVWKDTVNRLATDNAFIKLDPITQNEVLKKAHKHFNELAKGQTAKLPSVKEALDAQEADRKRKRAVAKERSRQIVSGNAGEQSPLEKTLSDFGLQDNTNN